jgi:hypothetical protein
LAKETLDIIMRSQEVPSWFLQIICAKPTNIGRRLSVPNEKYGGMLWQA